MKAIIFGITGQDGSHLADLLLAKNYQVIGVARRSSTDNTERVKHLKNNINFKVIEGDITDVSSVLNIYKDNENVDEIYNLAAQSHVATSFKQPALTWDITGKGCINLLQSLIDLNMYGCRFYQASSSEMFGDSFDVDCNGNKFQNENTKFLPQSPYAIAKCAAHYTVRLFREAYGLHASSGILFNHEGPRRGDQFVTKKITNWVADFNVWLKHNKLTQSDLNVSGDFIYGKTLGQNFPKLVLGNLDSYRDWGYAGDYVRAMWLMLQQDSADDYVICTGRTYTVRDFVTYAFDKICINDWSNFVTTSKEFYRPAEVDFLRGDYSKAKNKLGWEPKYNLDSLVSIMVNNRLNEKLQSDARHF
jgi:GDPmannose 4,6-dehydratase